MLLVNRLLLIFSLNFLPITSEATPAFVLGNEAYQNKNFPQAISLYQESLEASQSFAQHFNLGNAYYENKEYGPAILHYEKALTIEPHNPEVLQNLQKSYETLQIHPEKSGNFEPFFHIFSAYTWSWISIILVLTGFTAFCLLLFNNSINPLTRITLWICVPLSMLLVGINIFFANQTQWGVILKNEAPLRVSPTNSSPITTSLHEGTKAKLIKSKKSGDNFVLIKTPNNKEGWISKNDFKLIWTNLG